MKKIITSFLLVFVIIILSACAGGHKVFFGNGQEYKDLSYITDYKFCGDTSSFTDYQFDQCWKEKAKGKYLIFSGKITEIAEWAGDIRVDIQNSNSIVRCHFTDKRILNYAKGKVISYEGIMKFSYSTTVESIGKEDLQLYECKLTL